MYKVNYIVRKYHKFIDDVVSVNQFFFIIAKVFLFIKIEINTQYQTFAFLRYIRNLFRKVKVMVIFVFYLSIYLLVLM